MTYYIKGGSRYNEANPTVWVALNLAGFPDSKYLDGNWKQINYETIIDNQDPFWLLGSISGGAKEIEIGLYNDRRIKISTTGIYGWNGSAWKNLIGDGGGGDADAIHVNLASEISGIAEKTTPVNADVFVIEDSAASFVKKKVLLSKILIDKNVDGGKSDSVYLPSQIIDGGSA